MWEHWEKFRFVAEGGHDFVDEYLKKYTTREEQSEFEIRKEISYSPSHSKQALIDVRNAIYQRMPEITRKGGTQSYQDAVAGQYRGVDRKGSSMNLFVGEFIMLELLMQGKVAVYIDKPQVKVGASKADVTGIRPYMYYYTAEDIRTWGENPDTGEINAVLLRDHTWKLCETTGLIVGRTERYRYVQQTSEKEVTVKMYDAHGTEIPDTGGTVQLTQIPVVIPELSQSLLTDIADHQIALLNLASADLMYALQANFPFYTEQFNPMTDAAHLRPETADGTEDQANTAADPRIKVGVTQGRKYPKDTERPAFIHPSSEPLKASMEKQQQIKEEIRQLIALSLSNLEARHASVDSKRHDDLGLEAGLSYIGVELEWFERQVQNIWSEYEGEKPFDKSRHISYPRAYSLKSESERRDEASDLTDLMAKLPSETFQKETAKQAASTLHAARISEDVLQKMHEEIDASDVVVVDPEVIKSDHEAGFVSTGTASQLRGYDAKEVEQAKKDHEDRLQRIAISQQKDGGFAAARGNPDGDDDPKEEKKNSQDPDLQEDGSKAVRGKAGGSE
jgi:hypothetical protein